MSTSTSPVDIRADHLEIVQDILCTHLPAGFEVWVFGSRANWTTKDSSDLDLAVEGAASLDHGVMVGLEIAFEESDLPYTVDVVDLNTVSLTFRQIVEGQKVPLPPSAGDILNKRYDNKDWISCTLADVCEEINYGLTASGSDDSSGPKFLRITDIVSGQLDWNTVPHVQADEPTTMKYMLSDGDIVIARTGASTGSSIYVKNPPYAVFASYLVRLKVKPEFDPRFVSYYLKCGEFWQFIRGVLGDKSAQPNASASTMTAAPFSAPRDLEEQRAIAHILGTLDDKIELNRRMNRTLEEMARAIFQDWFVDFGPTRAKLEGREPYLPPDLWSLFPDRLVDSELGEIPEGWEVRAFGQLLSDVIGGDWGKETPDPTNTEPVSIIRGTDIPNLRNGGVGSVPLRYTTKKKVERRILHHGDIVIEVSGGSPTQPTGRSMLVTRDILERFPTTVVCASFCRRFRPRGWADGLLAAQHLDYANSIGKMWDYQLQSTGISNFQTKRFLGEEQIIWPGDAMAGEFANAIDPIVKHATRNESRTLTAQRDALLPKLVLGEIKMDRIYG